MHFLDTYLKSSFTVNENLNVSWTPDFHEFDIYVPEIQKLKSQQILRHCWSRLRKDPRRLTRGAEAGWAQPWRAQPWEEAASGAVEAVWEARPCPWGAAPAWESHSLQA